MEQEKRWEHENTFLVSSYTKWSAIPTARATHMAKHKITSAWQPPKGEDMGKHEKSMSLMKTIFHSPIIIFPQDFNFFFSSSIIPFYWKRK